MVYVGVPIFGRSCGFESLLGALLVLVDVDVDIDGEGGLCHVSVVSVVS